MENRHRIAQHFTASGVVLCHEHILLVHHRRIQAWLPPGGHIEDFEMPHEAAAREIFEETGVEVEMLGDRLPQTGDPDAFFLAQPLCLHAVRARENGEDVYHLDIAYLCVPRGFIPGEPAAPGALPDLKVGEDVKEARWVRLSDLDRWNLAKNVREAVALALTALARS